MVPGGWQRTTMMQAKGSDCPASCTACPPCCSLLQRTATTLRLFELGQILYKRVSN